MLKLTRFNAENIGNSDFYTKIRLFLDHFWPEWEACRGEQQSQGSYTTKSKPTEWCQSSEFYISVFNVNMASPWKKASKKLINSNSNTLNILTAALTLCLIRTTLTSTAVKIINKKRCYDNLRQFLLWSLEFHATHPLCGSKHWRMKIQQQDLTHVGNQHDKGSPWRLTSTNILLPMCWTI